MDYYFIGIDLCGVTQKKKAKCLPLIIFISTPTLCFALQPLPESEYNSDPETVGYRLRAWRTDGQGEDRTEAVDGTGETGEATVEDLNPWTQYQVQIQAYNSIGPGPWSNTVHARTAESGTNTMSSLWNIHRNINALTLRQPKLSPHLITSLCLSHALISEKHELIEWKYKGLTSTKFFVCICMCVCVHVCV